jgi:putative polyketide hydroxylase
VLLTGDPGWADAATSVAARRGLPLTAHHIGGELTDPRNAWTSAYGVPGTGAVLIRPDGVIGWRTTANVDADALDAALGTILDRR